MPEKHIPLRMCVVSRKMLPKEQLYRLVVKPNGLIIDRTQKMPGRGYWISRDLAVISEARRRHTFNRILKKDIGDSIYAELEDMLGAE